MNPKKLEENIKFFDNLAGHYDSTPIISNWLKSMQIKVIEEILEKDKIKVLDIGCGTGYALNLLSKKTSKSVLAGIDISEKMLEMAKNNLKDIKNNKVILKKANVEDIPFPSKHFDYIICTDALHHLVNPEKAFEEMSRILKDNGELIIADISIPPFWLSNIIFKLERGFVHLYSKSEIKSLIQNHNLRLMKQKRIELLGLISIGIKGK
jgi:ubiquinone/menaquinone biosynthesis C-methylase UbiE